jgi:hypothetical protein
LPGCSRRGVLLENVVHAEDVKHEGDPRLMLASNPIGEVEARWARGQRYY